MNKVANVVAIEDETGREQMDLFRSALIREVQRKHKAKVRFVFFQKALEYLSLVERQHLDGLKAVLTIEIDGKEYSHEFELVKVLTRRPIYELRVDYGGTHIRATFFPKFYNGSLYYCFVKGFIKTRFPPFNPTNDMRDLTYDMFKKVNASPHTYLQ